MIIAHKIARDPAPEQAVYFVRAAGTVRFAWNWSLGRWQEEYALWKQYQCGPKPSEASVRRALNALKPDAFPWMLEVTKNAPQQAIKDLGTAFKNFFDGCAKYARFKKKGVSHDSFRADPGPDKLHPNAVEGDGKRIKRPVIGWLKMREAVRFNGKIKSAIISRTADRWFVSLSVEVDHTIPVRKTQVAGGVDLGVKALATLSEGTTIEAPRRCAGTSRRCAGTSRRCADAAVSTAARSKARLTGAGRRRCWPGCTHGLPTSGKTRCTRPLRGSWSSLMSLASKT